MAKQEKCGVIWQKNDEIHTAGGQLKRILVVQ